MFPFIQSSIFIFQNLYDSWQINNILRIGCSGYNKPMTSCSAAQMDALEAYGAAMRTALAPAIAAPKVGTRPGSHLVSSLMLTTVIDGMTACMRRDVHAVLHRSLPVCLQRAARRALG